MRENRQISAKNRDDAMTNIRPRDLKSADLHGNIRELARRQIGAPRRPDDTSEQASNFIRRVALESVGAIDRLIDDLKNLRGKLEDEGNRVQRDVATYASLSQSVVQLANIVSDSMTHVKTFSDFSIGIDARNSAILPDDRE